MLIPNEIDPVRLATLQAVPNPEPRPVFEMKEPPMAAATQRKGAKKK